MSIGWLPTADRGLLAKRRIDQAYRVAVETGNGKQAPVRRVARNLRRLGHVLEPHFGADALALRVYQEQRRLDVVNGDNAAAVRRDSDARKRTRRLDLAEQFSLWEVDHRNRGIFLVLGI